MPRILSVSLAPYDGVQVEQAFESLMALGVRVVEPAYIVGYTEPFDETAFLPAEARRLAALLHEFGIGCHAVSAHIDLGKPDSVAVFWPRMDFARSLGARVINTNASLRSLENQFRRNIEVLARHGEDIGLSIGLENPGNGEDNLFNTARDGIDLLKSLALPAIGLNFDAANLASHRPEADTTRNALDSLPGCIHFHVKDVARRTDGWHFTPIGAGDIDNVAILHAVASYPELPISLELPLRLRRGVDAQPIRAPEPQPIAEIEAAVKASLAYLDRFRSEP